MKRVATVAIVVVLLAGCGTLNGPRTGTISPPVDALTRWNDFPSGQVPRPIVLFDNFVTTTSYPSSEVKLAALCGKFILGFQPSTVVPNQAVANWADGSSARYPAITAHEAYSALVDHPRNPSDPGCTTVKPLVLSASRFTAIGFETDRGPAVISAWLFAATNPMNEFGYPALVPTAFWQNGPIAGSIGDRAAVSADGRTLTFSFPGGPPDGQCATDYTGVPAESPHAVAVAVQSSPGRPQGGPNGCDLVTQFRSVTIGLASPLDGRVVVDASGAPVAVCPERVGTTC